MRVATYNLHDCIGRDGRFDPGRTAGVLRELDVDVLALQEVTVDDVGERLAQFESATGMRALDGSLFARGLGRYGNLILSRHTVLDSRLHDLSIPGREPRGCIEATIGCAGARVRCFATHLGLGRRERMEQVRRLALLLDNVVGTAGLLLGDLNLWRLAASRPLHARRFVGPAVRSFPTWPTPIVALDRILARLPAAVERCWRHDSPAARVASDHFPVIAEIRLDAD